MVRKKKHAVDLDGTIAEYSHFISNTHIGKPIPKMIDRIKHWLEIGDEVVIFTARMGKHPNETDEDKKLVKKAIEAWCLKHIGKIIPITCEKTYDIDDIWDDRAVRVIKNTGEIDNEYKE